MLHRDVYFSSNWAFGSEGVQTVNPGAYCKFILRGQAVRFDFATDHLQNRAPFLLIQIDQNRYEFALSRFIDISLPVPERGRAHHDITLLYEGRGDLDVDAWGRFGERRQAIIIRSIEPGEGANIAPPTIRPRKIDIDGNSITEGFGTLSAQRGHASNGFAFMLGTLLDAEVNIRGWTANGIGFGGRGNAPNWADMIRQEWSGQPRLFPADLAALVICEGDNDGRLSSEALAALVRAGILEALARVAATTHIIMCGPFFSSARLVGEGRDAREIGQSIQSAVRMINHPRVHYVPVDDLYNAAETLDGAHPNRWQSAHVIAPALASRIASIVY